MTAGEFRLLSESEVDFDAEPSAAEGSASTSSWLIRRLRPAIA
jgi:hypothetical protein